MNRVEILNGKEQWTVEGECCGEIEFVQTCESEASAKTLAQWWCEEIDTDEAHHRIAQVYPPMWTTPA